MLPEDVLYRQRLRTFALAEELGSVRAALQIIAVRVPVPAEALPWGALITSVLVLVVASAAAIWRPSLLPALAAFFGGALLLMPASLFWLIRLNASS